MLIAAHSAAIGRQFGEHRCWFVVARDQHDLAKVNSGT
jgi:hypothetical protein